MAPSLVVIAGPNGAGKTSLTHFLIGTGWHFGQYINPDHIALRLAGSNAAITDSDTRNAQEIADAEREFCLSQLRDHCFETVMSHPSKVDYMLRARTLGYRVHLHFVGVESPMLSMMRVFGRVQDGGHSVPPDKIEQRYARTMAALPRAIAAADHSVIYDNSRDRSRGASDTGPAVIAEYQDGRCIFRDDAGLRWPSLYLPRQDAPA
jgi:predicted ABC-type ATPase